MLQGIKRAALRDPGSLVKESEFCLETDFQTL